MRHTRETFFTILLLVITLLNIYDFYNDYQESDHSSLHLWVEALIIVSSLAGISFLIHESRQRRYEAENLRQQLSNTRTDLSNTRKNLSELNDKLSQASQQYSEVIQEQMSAWDFTPSEKAVALLLLKGLSFDEVAAVRETKEKTVRQQASTIYRKSGLNGRHELAAWFFEDFLN